MSWQFIKDWAQRVTNEETLIIRKELILLIGKKRIIKTSVTDQHGNNNLLLPNFIKGKNDNWDIDIFLYYDIKKIKTEEIVERLKNNNKVLKITKNDKIWSFLYQSIRTWKKIQVDLHIIKNSKENLDNYFNYFRVPYLFFIFWMIFRKLNIKLWINWLFYVITATESKKFFKLESRYVEFLKKILNINISDIESIDSYDWIKNFIDSTWLTNYDFFKLKEMKWKYLKKMRNNQKLVDIIEWLKKPTQTINDYKKKFDKKLLNNYSYLPKKEKQFLNEIEKSKNLAKKRKEDLLKIFNTDSLKTLKPEKKQFIWKISGLINEMILLKEILALLKEKYPTKQLYLVWGAVRDILLWKWNKDWDLSWNYSSKEFQSVIGWIITEKFWTVFYKYKWLEIEYTPFRVESDYDWRKPWIISFDANLEEDALRRDFTINSMYLNIDNFDILDIYNWKEDLKNKLIKAVWNADDRFSEDYLRILRWIRLSAKIEGKIEEKTYNSMLKLSNNINSLSDERIMEEFFKWFNIKENRKYILYLNKFWNESKLFKNILDTYKSFNPWEIYTLLYYIVNKDLKRLQTMPWLYSWKTKQLFVLWLKHLNKQFPNNINKRNIKNFLYELSAWNYTRKDMTKLLIILWNLNILDWKLDRKKLKEIINIKKEIDKNKENYTLIHLKEKWIDIKKEIKDNNVNPQNIKKYLKEKYIDNKDNITKNIKIDQLKNR